MGTAAAAPFRTRPDITPYLIHFTRGLTRDAAFAVLDRILFERKLRGGEGFIKGNYRCVCFTEAPLDELCEIFWWSKQEPLRYEPFGILVEKAWLFAQGGRPVIYQSDGEFCALPEELRYRHVRYEPHTEPPIDFSWEREWRLHADELPLDPAHCRVVVLHGEYEKALVESYEQAQRDYIQQLALAIGDQAAEQHTEPFPWRVIDLDDLRPEWHYAELYEDMSR